MVKTTTPPISNAVHESVPVVSREPKTNKSKTNTPASVAAVLVGSIVISILMLEFCLAYAGLGEEEYLKRDPEIGWVMMPNKHITWRHEGYSVTRVNSAGMLDREFPIEKSKDTIRIAVVGDSYTEALQVPREQNFCKVIERSLAADASVEGKKIEVLNFGISAYNIAQIYMRMKNLAVKYSPDIVVVTESVDSTRGLSPEGGGFFRARPNFTLDANNRLLCNYDRQNAWLQSPEGLRVSATGWLREHSRIWGVIAKAVEQVTIFMDGIKHGETKFGAAVTEKKTTFEAARGPACVNGVFIEPEAVYSPKLPSVMLPQKQAELRKWWPVHNQILNEMKKECSAVGADMVLVRLPQVNGYDNIPESELLKTFATKNGVTWIDATKAFLMYNDRKVPLFYDPHMSANGHKVLAKQLTEELKPVIRARLE
jgi:lysophospholipase L1-like esterase